MGEVMEAKKSLAETSIVLAFQFQAWADEGGEDAPRWEAERKRLIEQAEWCKNA